MIEFYKILNGLDKCDKDQPFTMQPNPRTRGHSQNLYRKKHKQTKNKTIQARSKKHFFSQKVNDGWNSLTEEVISLDLLKVKQTLER